MPDLISLLFVFESGVNVDAGPVWPSRAFWLMCTLCLSSFHALALHLPVPISVIYFLYFPAPKRGHVIGRGVERSQIYSPHDRKL